MRHEGDMIWCTMAIQHSVDFGVAIGGVKAGGVLVRKRSQQTG